ncbi:MAG TPA: hypothetical protein VJY11_01295, partial [Erysipelothrix sp.]|nr:hypothetical protein [Erysipelothrix sp.]
MKKATNRITIFIILGFLIFNTYTIAIVWRSWHNFIESRKVVDFHSEIRQALSRYLKSIKHSYT